MSFLNLGGYGKFVGKPVIGKMYHFSYWAKHRMTLKYWDAFPLSIISGPAPNGFYGINIHYVRPVERQAILSELMEHTIRYKGDQKAIFRADYNFLQTLYNEDSIKFCFKHYLWNHVRSSYLQIDPRYYNQIIVLPTQQWMRKEKRGKGPY